ncbi:MAG: type I-E CRISPR-associated protein Cas5/CasD [Geminicoccaceae bacterium]
MRCLILRLDGPLMAFGDVAVDEIRPTRRLPTLSMLTGLLGNALGYDHGDGHALQRLQDRLLIAARLDHPGRTIVDYQTAEIAKKDPMWTTRGKPAERAGGDQSYSGPVLRYRHYVADAVVTVAVSLEPAGEAPTLDHLEEALRRPARPLFLGRKGCPPARPLLVGRSQEVDGFAEALDAIPVEQRRGEHSGTVATLVEVPDRAGEPTADRVVEVADVRDWVSGLHVGGRRVRELRIAHGGEP